MSEVDPQTLVRFVAGGVLLIAGAGLLVRGASRLAIGLGISSLVVGLTVVAFGTSSPELAVTVGSAYRGAADVALGNVVGSSMFRALREPSSSHVPAAAFCGPRRSDVEAAAASAGRGPR